MEISVYHFMKLSRKVKVKYFWIIKRIMYIIERVSHSSSLLIHNYHLPAAPPAYVSVDEVILLTYVTFLNGNQL